eukprot:gb/GFBE01072187.1/.p1 GENE.gb/GFBE01072187.1/~~gb/GFBE01072187.1/.p1  ORF type:complete len:599 (+),score=108.37 gb/GFBE01072187.1/:1-1797(+)
MLTRLAMNTAPGFYKLDAGTFFGYPFAVEFSPLSVVLTAMYLAFALLALADVRKFATLFLCSDEPVAGAGALVAGAGYGSNERAEKRLSDNVKPPPHDLPSPISYGRSPGASPSDQASWSTLSIAGLTFYRFYSGFSSATWLPYLLAREGEDLWYENQAAFMGCAKLIYGATMLLNPMMGLFGDRAVARSHGLGRRLFVRAGVLCASMGILICMLSDWHHNFYWFMFGILLWRLGETMNDVTVEAVAPELVPASQYPLASAVKASLFLVGGVVGYVLLIIFAEWHYSWLYKAYLFGMLTCAIPLLMLLDDDTPRRSERWLESRGLTYTEYLRKAYIIPAQIPGGFPLACLSVFIFSLGTAPMFFLLLMVRDLVGIHDEVAQQREFSTLSIVFFLSAAVASVFAARTGRSSDTAEAETDEQREEEEERAWKYRGNTLLLSVIVFGLIAISLPFMSFMSTIATKSIYFYVMATVFGLSFGAAFSRFQDCTWQLLPPEVDMATSMGFNVMSRNAGVGIGNFLAGMSLDCFRAGPRDLNLPTWVHPEIVRQLDLTVVAYTATGYYVMCGLSGVTVLVSAYFADWAVNHSPHWSKSILRETKP